MLATILELATLDEEKRKEVYYDVSGQTEFELALLRL